MNPTSFNKNISHPLQSYEWGEYFKQLGCGIVRQSSKDSNGIIRGIQVLIQKTAVKNYSLAYVPRGVFPDKKQLVFLEAVKKKYSCVSVKVEPDCGWFYPLRLADKAQKRRFLKEIKALGGLKSQGVYPKHTMLIPLGMTEEMLLASMHQKNRYNVRISERRGVEILTDTSERGFKEFLDLFFNVTVVREKIAFPHSPEILKAFWKTMKPTGAIHLLKAVYKGETLAVMMLVKFKDRLYFPHGASSRVHSSFMPNHGLMWSAMKFGRKLGCSYLDLWGINNSKSLDEFDRSSGLFRFYSGFGAKIFERIGAFDFLTPSQ